MKINKVHHVAIICSDYQRSKEFYVDKLGFKIIAETYREIKNSYKLDLDVDGQTQIELFSFPDSPKRPSYPEACDLRHLAFEVENIVSTVQELVEKGIKVEDIRTDEFTGKKFTFFADPDGLPLEISEQ